MKKDPNNWNIEELEHFFTTTNLPQTARLNNVTILDVPTFVTNHLNFIKQNAQKMAFMSYFERLTELKNFIENES